MDERRRAQHLPLPGGPALMALTPSAAGLARVGPGRSANALVDTYLDRATGDQLNLDDLALSDRALEELAEIAASNAHGGAAEPPDDGGAEATTRGE
jgi:hypothetical protein